MKLIKDTNIYFIVHPPHEHQILPYYVRQKRLFLGFIPVYKTVKVCYTFIEAYLELEYLETPSLVKELF